MDIMLTNPVNNKKIRRPVVWCLVFSFLLISCSDIKKDPLPVSIQWQNNRAVSMTIPRELLQGVAKDSVEQLLHIQLENTNTPVLGEYIITDEAVVFRPLVAFTRGLNYEVWFSGKLLNKVVIPSGSTHDAPKIVAVYPTSDTVPLNLLKIYIVFSKPMQEGQSLNNITVIKNQRDTVPSVFLDLELWNNERTIHTLWLDPGRIKRDLQPNKTMGAPLQQGESYQVIIKQDWRDVEGVSLASEYQRDFVVGLRDSLSPDAESWTIHTPKAGGHERLKIDLHESLDYVLLKNTVRVVDKTGKVINGVIETAAEETILYFTPSGEWSPGDYTLEIESRLEDLAGNNLNRLFDKDLTRQSKKATKEIYKRSFRVQ
ncbi:MAG TPA: Ig-like domain-containing protein [Chitinophagaceae bacterium]